MNDTQKQAIREALERHLSGLSLSQSRFAKRAGVSAALVSQLLNGNWENISEQAWRKIAAAVGYSQGWQAAETTNFKLVTSYCALAQQSGIAKLIAYDAGAGKSFALRQYALHNKNVFYVQCERFFTQKVLLRKLCAAVGVQASGSIAELFDALIDALNTLDKPLVIFDEFDKILEKRGVFDVFKTLYDATEGRCGFVLCGAVCLREELRRRVDRNKIGYVELFSRCGREFLQLRPITKKDIEAVCVANGITAPAVVGEIVRDLGNGDYRTLRTLIERKKTELLWT